MFSDFGPQSRCNDCKKAPAHIGRCFSDTGYCVEFPYDMPEFFGEREDLFEPKEFVGKHEQVNDNE